MINTPYIDDPDRQAGLLPAAGDDGLAASKATKGSGGSME
jgi:hypothetical protein